MNSTVSTASLDREVELLRMRTAHHDAQKFDVRSMKAVVATYIDNTAFVDIIRRGIVQNQGLVWFQSHGRVDGLDEPVPVVRWLHRSGSFRTATLRFAFADVERRALRRTGNESEFSEDTAFLDFNVHQASRLARQALARGNAVPLPVAPEGGYPRREDRLRAEQMQRYGRLHRSGAPSVSVGAGRAAFRLVAEFMLAAAAEVTYRSLRTQLSTADKIVGLVEALGAPQRVLSLEATRAASAAIRVGVDQRVTHRCPGRAVAASPRVCRGPNTAGAPLIPDHLRGLRIPY